MAYEQKENTISIFKNDKKSKESQPDYRIVLNWQGEMIEGAAWKKVSKAGKAYLSGKLQTPRTREDQRPQDDDSIPF